MIQALDLRLERLEVLADHASQDLPFLLVGVDIVVSDLLDVFDRIARMHLLALEVVLDAALGLADGAGALTGDAAADLDGAQGVQLAERVLLAVHGFIMYDMRGLKKRKLMLLDGKKTDKRDGCSNA